MFANSFIYAMHNTQSPVPAGIKQRNMYDLKNTTKLSDGLYALLCVIRLFVFIPLILTCIGFVPLMYLLGIKNAIDIWVDLCERIVFDVKD